MKTFAGTLIKPYVGVLAQAPAFAGNCQVRTVPVRLNWNDYGVSSTINSMGVNVSLVGKGAQANIIPRMTSMYVDNTESNATVYILFLDTGQVIPVLPYSSGWFECLTSGYSCIVYGYGFVTGQIPITQIHFTDAFVPPFASLEVSQTQQLMKASRSITRGNTIFNQDFSVPALGDQTQQADLDLTQNAPTITLFGTPYAAPINYIYLLGLSVTLIGYAISGGSTEYRNLFVESTGSAGILFKLRFAVRQTNADFYLFQQVGMNLKLDASQTWRIRGENNITQGYANAVFNYSVNPY